ncbi:glycosyltransferase [Changchengzhania lutea]|uniref:glycosyltransferase n=1 Tax=Changchengzhania lutea TaxID=2049305 RepID=UPI00115D2BCD|nr:glycosyltransferase [Changchengzhania lutea]
MSIKKLNIAIFSPSKNPYSETFIQAHKNCLKGNVFYYYGIGSGINLESGQIRMSRFKILLLKIYAKLTKKPSAFIWAQKLLHSLKINKIDVILVEYGVHAHHLRNMLKVSALPIVVHFHGYDASIYKVIEDCEKYKEVFQLSTTIIAVSKKMEDALLELGCPKNKLIYNVYGPQLEFAKIKPKFLKKQFIAVGRFTDKKAPYYVILAFRKVLEVYPNAKLLFAGSGYLKETCENLVKYFDLTNNIRFMGVISAKQYRFLLEESRAFVQHSITASNGDMEGTPLSILEASISGLPIISTHHAGIPDVVFHGKTGLLSKEHDIDTMSKHMLMLLKDKKLAKKLGANGKNHIKEHVSLERHIEGLQRVLEMARNSKQD